MGHFPSYRGPASSGGQAISDVVLDAEGLKSLLIGAGEKQTSPANPVPQPLRNHGVVLDMRSELPRSKLLPVVIRSATFDSALHLADFDVSVLNSVFFDPRTVCSFESKVYWHQRHVHTPFPARDIRIRGWGRLMQSG